HHGVVTVATEAVHHVGAHPAEPDKADLHGAVPSVGASPQRAAVIALTAPVRLASTASRSPAMCTRTTRRPCVRSDCRSPAACARLRIEKVYGAPGIVTSVPSSAVI